MCLDGFDRGAVLFTPRPSQPRLRLRVVCRVLQFVKYARDSSLRPE